MTTPGQTITIRDPGLGLVEPAANACLIMGIASASRQNEFAAVNSIQDLAAGWGDGPLVQDGARILSEPNRPQLYVCQVTGGVVGTNTAVTQTGGGPLVTVAGAPYDTYDARIEVRLGGILGAGKFRYTLDRQTLTTGPDSPTPTWSPDITIPGGGTFLIPGTNVTATFAAGTYILGATYDFTCTEPYYNGTNLSDAMTSVVLQKQRRWRMVHLAGNAPSASSAATIASAFGTHMATAQTAFRYTRGFLDAGSKDTTTNLATSFGSFVDPRIAPMYGQVVRSSLKPFVGFSTPRRSGLAELSSRAAANMISTSMMRVATGALNGVRYIAQDEFSNPVVDDLRVTSLRTWPGRPGFYINQGRLASAVGSDFAFTHNGFIMDVACATVVGAQQSWAGKSFRLTSAGTLDPLDAEDLRQDVLKQLRAQLTEPLNAEGKRGHVSALNYRVDLTNNVLVTSQILTEVSMRPLGYARDFVTQLGFAVDVGVV